MYYVLTVGSHVVLGFSRCGQLLLSYRSELDVTATQSTYTLHWWRFLGHYPLQHVSTCASDVTHVHVYVCYVDYVSDVCLYM